MAQPFRCLCGTSSCRGTISGAGNMKPSQLEGYWINGHIRELLDEREQKLRKNVSDANATNVDPTAQALKLALAQAEQVVESTRSALQVYLHQPHRHGTETLDENGALGKGLERRGPTSRELAGEMGGDTLMV